MEKKSLTAGGKTAKAEPEEQGQKRGTVRKLGRPWRITELGQ
jgi:hypothetical protein